MHEFFSIIIGRTSGNLCLGLPRATCSREASSVQTPRVTEPRVKKSKTHIKAIVGGIVGGATCMLIICSSTGLLHKKTQIR